LRGPQRLYRLAFTWSPHEAANPRRRLSWRGQHLILLQKAGALFLEAFYDLAVRSTKCWPDVTIPSTPNARSARSVGRSHCDDSWPRRDRPFRVRTG